MNQRLANSVKFVCQPEFVVRLEMKQLVTNHRLVNFVEFECPSEFVQQLQTKCMIELTLIKHQVFIDIDSYTPFFHLWNSSICSIWHGSPLHHRPVLEEQYHHTSTFSFSICPVFLFSHDIFVMFLP